MGTLAVLTVSILEERDLSISNKIRKMFWVLLSLDNKVYSVLGTQERVLRNCLNKNIVKDCFLSQETEQ